MNLNKLLSIVLFYWENSVFKKSGNFATALKVKLAIALFTMGYGLFNIIQTFDWINFGYLVLGLLFSVYFLISGFSLSYNIHKSLLKESGYASLHDYYLKRGN